MGLLTLAGEATIRINLHGCKGCVLLLGESDEPLIGIVLDEYGGEIDYYHEGCLPPEMAEAIKEAS
jgi:hypothetical protein